jgi:imidazolonepropionase-like amidohydrolase
MSTLGVLGEVGMVEVGKTAVLVLLEADPVENISNARKINSVCWHQRGSASMSIMQQ